MPMKVEFVDDENVRRHTDEPNHVFNPSSEVFVQLRPLTMSQLRLEWEEFKSKLRVELHSLLSMKCAQVREEYGLLDHSSKTFDNFAEVEYGLVFSDAAGRSNHFNHNAIIKALVTMGQVRAKTPHGKPRKRVKDLGGVAICVETLSTSARSQLIYTLLNLSTPLDEIIKFNQTSLIDDAVIDDYLRKEKDALAALEAIAKHTSLFFQEQRTKGNESKARGAGRVYGWAWFAQHLSARGIWLQPVSHIADIVNLYPRKLAPLAIRMAVPDAQGTIAKLVWGRMKASKNTASGMILNVFLTLAQSSNAFAASEMVRWPLRFFKEWVHNQKPSRELRSSSINHLYRLLCAHFGVKASTDSHAHFFLGKRRVGNHGVEAFAWCDHPTPRNTRVAARCLGKPIREVPQAIRDWADIFRELLSLFNTKSVSGQIDDLNTWLYYLLYLGDKAPKSFHEISRSEHVNDLSQTSDTWVNFVHKNFSNTKGQIGYRAPSTLAKTWRLAATRYGFAERGNPFDVKLDRLVKAPIRLAKSTRQALDHAVMEILVQENRKNDFEFARSLGERGPRYNFIVMNSKTTRLEEVFFPLCPIVIDVILHTGIRKHQARWLDSGEGDEFNINPSTKQETANLLKTATKSRNQGFLRVCEFMDGGGRRRELGMFINTNKTGKPYEVPWIDAELAEHVSQLAKLQSTYNPISAPVLARDPDVSDLYGYNGDLPLVYPLFRNPQYDLHLPISDAMVSDYWRELLTHCQPVVERRLGYAYPLISDGKPHFDIHALRITTVTVLHESGVSIDIIQALVGHSSVMMTWYYRQVKFADIHRALNKFHDRTTLECDLAARLLSEAVTAPNLASPAGLALLQEHDATRAAPIDVFAHGICAGGDCKSGGKRVAEGRYQPVFRPRACSRCRYRVTGPAFLTGLVHRANALMYEIKTSQAREKQFNKDADHAEDNDQASSHFRALAGREREDRDELFSEWCAENQTIQSCRSMQLKGGDLEESLMPARKDFDGSAFDLSFVQVHEFELLHRLVVTTNLVPETMVDLPPGAEATRNEILHRIMHHNNLADLLFQVDPHTRKRTLDIFGDILVKRVENQNQLQGIIEGAIDLKDISALHDIHSVLRLAIESPTTREMRVAH